MKYIRTKDRIYDATLFLREYTGWYFNGRIRFYTCAERDIIKEADTIEELCDEYVIEHQNPYYIEHYLADKKTDLKATNEYIGVVYGAIWTERGLIYVAKLNEQGDLELL